MKPKIALRYGERSISFEYNPKRFEVLAPLTEANTSLTAKEIAERLGHPIQSKSLTELSRGARRVLIAVADLTRPSAADVFLPVVLEQLQDAGVPASRINAMFATGLHRAPAEVEKRKILGEKVFGVIETFDHHPRAPEELISVGTTSRGTLVQVNRRIFKADLVLLAGAIGFHYFAGFGGGRKVIVPGLASEQTIRANHLRVLNPHGRGRDPRVQVGKLNGNPVHDDLIDAMHCVEQHAGSQTQFFLVNSLLNERGGIEELYCGHWKAAHESGCVVYAEKHSISISGKRNVVIVSGGGFPRDLNVIQAHKALEHAQHAVQDGGTIILLAECRDGFGSEQFFPWFAYPTLEAMEDALREHYQVNGQTALALRSKAERYKIYLKSSLPHADVRAMGMEPFDNLEALLDQLDPSLNGFILPSSTLLPQPSSKQT